MPTAQGLEASILSLGITFVDRDRVFLLSCRRFLGNFSAVKYSTIPRVVVRGPDTSPKSLAWNSLCSVPWRIEDGFGRFFAMPPTRDSLEPYKVSFE